MVRPLLLPSVLALIVWAYQCRLLAAQDQQLPINRLDPVTRTKVVMALLALVILAFGAIACIRLGGRWAKRLSRSDTNEAKSAADRLPSDWDRKAD